MACKLLTLTKLQLDEEGTIITGGDCVVGL